MKQTDTDTLVQALRLLARDIHCEDGIATSVIREAADRIETLNNRNARKNDRIIALSRRVKNLRRALKEFMTSQVAFMREAKAEMRSKKTK